MIPIIIDCVEFQVYATKTLWSPPSGYGAFVEAPPDYAALARALVCCDYEARDGHVYVNDCLLLEALLDDQDRPVGLHLPLKPGLSPIRPLRVETGKTREEKLVTVLEWDDPLDAVITASEADAQFDKSEGTVRKALNSGSFDGQIGARKSGATWLIRRADAERVWGKA